MSDPSLLERVQGGTVFVMRGWIPAIAVEKNQIAGGTDGTGEIV